MQTTSRTPTVVEPRRGGPTPTATLEVAHEEVLGNSRAKVILRSNDPRALTSPTAHELVIRRGTALLGAGCGINNAPMSYPCNADGECDDQVAIGAAAADHHRADYELMARP